MIIYNLGKYKISPPPFFFFGKKINKLEIICENLIISRTKMFLQGSQEFIIDFVNHG